MKTISSFFKQVVAVGAIAMLFQTCSHRNAFQPSSIVPAAEGAVKIKNDKNNNYMIDLDVIRLAQPERLSPPRSVYVVWMKTAHNGIKNIGQLKTSSGLMSNTLKSSLEAVSSFEPTEIMITAENNAAEQYPGQVVLTTGSLEKK